MNYDVVLLHPPSLYDFRGLPWFPGPSARLVKTSTPALITIPIGLMSIADFLDRHGYRVKIYNLGELMVSNPGFDVENFLLNIQADVFGIDLHWCNHAQGSVEIARLCKKLHPESFVVIGGLTATSFAREIIEEFPFIDGVIRGEAEVPMLMLVEAIEKGKKFMTPNLTYRKNGKAMFNEDLKVVDSLDDFEYTRLDLLEPQKLMTTMNSDRGPWRFWWIPTCRGCVYNCVSCGGSSYSYCKLFNRSTLAFRSPEKIAEDFQKLSEYGFDDVFLFGDVRMGGKKYWRTLLETLHREKSSIQHICMELFKPGDSEFIQTVSRLRPAENITFTISLESGNEAVRRAHGRLYGDSEIIRTAELCAKHKFGLTLFFMLGLAEESKQTIDETFELWDKILRLNDSSDNNLPIMPEWGQMLLLDPRSMAFDSPEKHGYSLIFKTFKDYYNALSVPSWVEWISFETKNFTRDDFIDLSLYCLKRRLDIYTKHGLYDRTSADYLYKRIDRERRIVEELKDIMNEEERDKKISRLMKLNNAIKDGSIDRLFQRALYSLRRARSKMRIKKSPKN